MESRSQSELHQEGVEVLGVTTADHSYHRAPAADSVIQANATLIMHGSPDLMDELDDRRAGGERDNTEHASRTEEPRRTG